VEIQLEDAADADAAIAALAPICMDRPSVEGHVVRAPVRRRHGLIPEIVRALDDADVPIDDIALHRPTLDDVFMALTGHAAEEEPEQKEVAA
jgi:ABC-2 type transport system ATP-binding protein